MDPMNRYQSDDGPPQEFCAQCHGDYIRDQGRLICGTCGLPEEESRAVRAREEEKKRLTRERNARLQKAIAETNQPALAAGSALSPAAPVTVAAPVDANRQSIRRR